MEECSINLKKARSLNFCNILKWCATVQRQLLKGYLESSRQTVLLNALVIFVLSYSGIDFFIFQSVRSVPDSSPDLAG
jgi:hypothetical protein